MVKPIPVQVRLSPDVRRFLAVRAAETGKSQSEIVESLLETERKKSKR